MHRMVILLFSILSFLNSCVQEQQKTVTENGSEACELVRYASHLKIRNKENVYTVEIIDPDRQIVRFRAILAHKKPESIPEGYIYIRTPVKNIAVLSATQIGMLSRIGQTDAICAVSSGDYLYDPSIKARLEKNRIRDLGSEGEYSPEKIIAAGTKFILYSDFGKDFPNEKKLKKIGITCIPIPDWRELTPLGKAEWILFMGILSDSYVMSDQAFRATETRYLELTAMMKKITKRPLVLSGNMIGDSWAAPNGDSYHATLIEDAGGDYLYSGEKGTGSTIRTLEQVLKESSEVQFWINPGYNDCSGILMNSPKLKHLDVMNSGNIWCYSANMNKYWEQSACEPDKVLEDLIRIFHPGKLPKGIFNFYERVKK